MMPQPTDRDSPAGDAFWRFSLTFYARPGVADALLALQDRAGRDVNLILFGLWLGVCRRRVLTAAQMASAAAPIAGAVVKPLRRLRRELKGVAGVDVQDLRRRILGLEIAAERQVQRRLAICLAVETDAASGPGPLAAANANLALYLGAEAAGPEAGVVQRALASLTRADIDSAG